MYSFSREITGIAVWFPLTGGVRLREVFVSGGPTVGKSSA